MNIWSPLNMVVDRMKAGGQYKYEKNVCLRNHKKFGLGILKLFLVFLNHVMLVYTYVSTESVLKYEEN